MATPSAVPALRRDPVEGKIGGVAAGIAHRVGLDPWLVRAGFVVATVAGGWGLGLYLLLWALIPQGDGTERGRFATGRSAVEVALGAALLLLAALLVARHLGIWWSDVVVWPVLLIVGGGALLWRQSLAGPDDPDAPVQRPLAEEPDRAVRARRRAAVVSRTGLGVALVLAAGVAFLSLSGALAAARDAALAAIVVAVGLAVIFAPFITRLVRSLADERATRIREQERAEMAAHLHDSVLQTLALMQQRAEDPREVATLARRQERELRAWLNGGRGSAATLGAALDAAAFEVEETHRIPVDVVAVGDAPLDEHGEALVAAAREAMVNAARHGGGGAVRVYVEAGDEGVQVFVRDRGPGFDPGAVPADRRGVRESIVGRMARHGGHATIHATPGLGTEVELVLPRAAP